MTIILVLDVTIIMKFNYLDYNCSIPRATTFIISVILSCSHVTEMMKGLFLRNCCQKENPYHF